MSVNLEAGDKAPAFEGASQDGSTVRLSDMKGKKVALYFYPKDDTPGCTQQACNLRDHHQELIDAGIQVVGVSADPVEKHKKFAGKYDLPFPLIADTDKKILEAYGAFGEKKLYGRTFLGIKRMTYLIDEDGIIQKVIRKPKTGDHTAEVLAGFQS